MPTESIGAVLPAEKPVFLGPRPRYNAYAEADGRLSIRDRQPFAERKATLKGIAVPVLMELKRIIINEIHDSQIILLTEVDGDRAFPIVIGLFEAMSIEKRIKGVAWARPMTHDLICNLIDFLGGDLQDIYINELREHTYYAKLRVRKDGELVEVDCRPSDAIAVAVTAKVPIYVAEDVIEEALEEQ
jgi:hypothetical protein